MDPIRLTIWLGNARCLGTYAVMPSTEVVIGRAAASGFTFTEDWTPRELMRLIPAADYWLLRNEARAKVRIRNGWVGVERRVQLVGKRSEEQRRVVEVGTAFEHDALIALPDGVTDAEWNIFADSIRVHLEVGGALTDDQGQPLPRLRPVTEAKRDEIRRAANARRVGTIASFRSRPSHRGRAGAFAWSQRYRDPLTPRQRQVVAVTFRHLLEGTNPPPNLARAAAEELGVSEDAVKKELKRVRDKVNLRRRGSALTNAEVGELLIAKTGEVTVADLNPEHPDG